MPSPAGTHGNSDAAGADFKRKASYIELEQGPRTSLIITKEEKVGALAEVLAFFGSNNITLSHIESRPSRQLKGHYEFFVDVPGDEGAVAGLLPGLQALCSSVLVLGSEKAHTVPWFPQRLSDLDRFACRVLEYGEDLEADHPGFHDIEYRKRRIAITAVARNYKTGDKIPDIEYTAQEVETWGEVFRGLTALYPTHACKEHRRVFPLLQEYCGYNDQTIPQLQAVSDFLRRCTGFRLRPVAGLLSSRDFLNGLAFRTFHSTQYIRHPSKPLYTPEPDVCHELLGHVPLFADPDFAEFSQEIGLLSLGVSDDDIERLATNYWFTVEFGVCKEGGSVRAYGAGLLSSFGELQYCISEKPELRPFEPSTVAATKYPITMYQPTYFVAENFEDAKRKLREFGKTLSRPFTLRYNAYTESVEVLDTHGHATRLAHAIRSDMQTLVDALDRLGLAHGDVV